MEVFEGGKWQNGSSSNITQNREFQSMDWLDRPQSYKGLCGILQLLQGSHLDIFQAELGWVAFHSLKCPYDQIFYIFVHSRSSQDILPNFNLSRGIVCTFFGPLFL